MSGSSSSTTRGSGRGGRGGRGGFVPKKAVLEAMRARSSVSDDASKKTTFTDADIPHPLEQRLNETAESSNEKKRNGSDIVDYSDDEEIRGCDLCCDPDHRARFCPIFNKPKPMEPVIACYYCRKPGHIKSECPKKHRNDFNSSGNFGKGGQSQNRNFSENSGGSGSRYGTPPGQNQRSGNWSVIRANGNQFKGANFVNVPMPVSASSVKPALDLRTQFIPSTDVVGKNLTPELPPKSKIVFNRSDSEDYESDDEKQHVENEKWQGECSKVPLVQVTTAEENSPDEKEPSLEVQKTDVEVSTELKEEDIVDSESKSEAIIDTEGTIYYDLTESEDSANGEKESGKSKNGDTNVSEEYGDHGAVLIQSDDEDEVDQNSSINSTEGSVDAGSGDTD